MKELKRELLSGLKVMFDDEKIAAIQRIEGVDGGKLDMVSALFNDFTSENIEAIGEFFFSNSPELADGMMVFQSVITFAENVEGDMRELMDKAASLLNFYIESGSFCGDTEGNYSYRHSFIMSADMDKEVLQSLIDYNAAYAVGISSKYADIVVKVGREIMSLEEVEGLI